MITDEEHAEMLAEFFTTLFGPDERVHIFPMLAGGVHKFMGQINEIDEFVCGKQVKYWGYDWKDKNPETMNVQKWMPIRVPKPFSRNASSKSVKIIPTLRALSDAGYDLFFCINPLTGNSLCLGYGFGHTREHAPPSQSSWSGMILILRMTAFSSARKTATN